MFIIDSTQKTLKLSVQSMPCDPPLDTECMDVGILQIFLVEPAFSALLIDPIIYFKFQLMKTHAHLHSNHQQFNIIM